MLTCMGSLMPELSMIRKSYFPSAASAPTCTYVTAARWRVGQESKAQQIRGQDKGAALWWHRPKHGSWQQETKGADERQGFRRSRSDAGLKGCPCMMDMAQVYVVDC